MKPLSILRILVFVLLSPLSAQFSGPNASTYNPNNGKYYITNLYGKNVISLDAAGNKATFITGLNQPNNILFADLPLMSGFLILDSNEIKAYDDGGSFFASFSTTGALKLQDAVYDTSIQAIFISDVDRGVIYKTTFGAAPFYIPNTVIFSTPYRRPSAMVLQKTKNRILYVEDTIGGNLMAINLSNGISSQVKSLNINNLVGLAEDGQGNLYLSSQGTQAIYQLNKYYAGSPKKLYNEPKPGDLFVNIPKDRWVYTCLTCGTVFNPPLHIFGPGLEVSGCKTDSFTCYRNFLQKNIGTFDVGNKFVMELSNASGSFANPTFISEFADTLVPDSLMGQIPANLPSGNYKLRWRSTKPVAIGSQEVFSILPSPVFSISVSDTIQGCMNSTIELGTGNSQQNTYLWEPKTEVDTASKPSVKHQIKKPLHIYLTATSLDNCISTDTAFILPVSIPTAGALADTIQVCHGSEITMGANAQGGLKYLWSPGKELNDSTLSQPSYKGTENKKFKVTVTAEGGCSGNDSQFVQIKSLPSLKLVFDSIWICEFKTLLNSMITPSKKYINMWISPDLDTSYGDSKNFGTVGFPTGYYQVILNDLESQCSSKKSMYFNYYMRKKVTLTASNYRLNPSILLEQRKWYRNDTLFAIDSVGLNVVKSGNYKLCGIDSNGCDVCSDEKNFQANNVNITKLNDCYLYPVPANNMLQIGCTQSVGGDWRIFDTQGRLCLQGRHTEIDISSLKNGLYIFLTTNQIRTTFVKTN